MNYRTRLTSIRDKTSREIPCRLDSRGEIELDLDACRELLFAVLETAIRDYEYLRSIDAVESLTRTQAKRVRAILDESDPAEFFKGVWFQDICHFLGLNPRSVRELVESGRAGLAVAS